MAMDLRVRSPSLPFFRLLDPPNFFFQPVSGTEIFLLLFVQRLYLTL